MLVVLCQAWWNYLTKTWICIMERIAEYKYILFHLDLLPMMEQFKPVCHTVCESGPSLSVITGKQTYRSTLQHCAWYMVFEIIFMPSFTLYILIHSSKVLTIQRLNWTTRDHDGFRKLNPVSSHRGFPTELTPRGKHCCIVRIFEECRSLMQTCVQGVARIIIESK